MTRPAAAAPAPALARGLTLLGLAAVAIITLASPGATRMFAWPWSLAYALALAAPALALLARAFDPRRPLALPSRAWCALAWISAVVVLASALASPHRGPSLLWSAPLLAGVAFFFVVCDWLRTEQDHENPSARLAQFLAWAALAVMAASAALWLADLASRPRSQVFSAELFAIRNPHPLGHSNYTAGLALLALPWLALAAWRARGAARAGWLAGSALALLMLFVSGSRGGFVGLAALALAALWLTPLARKTKLLLFLAGVAVGLALALAHPRTRAMFFPADPGSSAAAPNISNVQRTAMLRAGWLMGRDRPLLGWGPGTVPLVYPRYRQFLNGGAENVLQLHSAPAQLWAELGAAGLACAAWLLWLVLRAAKSNSAAAATLAAYAVFALTDWQLDVPVFAFALATCAALLAAPTLPAATGECNVLRYKPASVGARRLGGAVVPAALALVAWLGTGDRTPTLNTRALALAHEGTAARTAEAITMLRESLALNPAQEIAHFNLGWLLVGRDPAAAGKHFLAAARLVPDKGGVYFGLGLARLNQNRPAAAARALALECLNDPAFTFSPWWREPALAALRDATEAEIRPLAAQLTPTQRARLPAFVALAAGGEKAFFRERTGYPVLMRDLDLAPPTDLFLVREFVSPPAALAALPPKGWLPSPLLLTWLAEIKK